MGKYTDLDIVRCSYLLCSLRGPRFNGQLFNTHLLRVIQMLSFRGMYSQPSLQDNVNHFTNLINI